MLLCYTRVSDDSNLPLWWEIRIIPQFWMINWSDWGGSCASLFLKSSLGVMQGPELLSWSKKSTEVMSRRFSSLQILLVLFWQKNLSVGCGCVYVYIFFPPEGVLNFLNAILIVIKATWFFTKYHGSLKYFFTASVWECFRSAWLLSVKTRTSLILDLIL